MDRLWAAAHGAIGIAFADAAATCDLARRLHARLSADLSVGSSVDASHRPQGARDSAEHASKIEAGRPEAPVLAGALGPAEGETR